MAPSSSTELYLIIAIGIIGMILLAGFLILFVILYQKRMLNEQLHRQELERDLQQRILQATLESQEAERRNLAGDLHDSIGGMLSAIRVGLAGLSRHLADPKMMDASKEMLDEALDSVRRISRELTPSTLEKFGLQAAVRELVERMQATSGIQISSVQLGQNRDVDKKREVLIYRILQELLNNAIKHSRASYIEVVLNYQAQLNVTVEDNGIGMNPDQFELHNGNSLGVYNIKSRVQLLGAEIEVAKEKSEGSRVLLKIPYEGIQA